MASVDDTKALLDRFARLWTAGQRSGDLNAVQYAALDYLARANRFSRSPAIVAEYLATTRGTASQTLKALIGKGFLRESRSQRDRRVVELDVTDEGRRVLRDAGGPGAVVQGLTDDEREALVLALRPVLTGMLDVRGGKAFGLCARCKFHEVDAGGRRCGLLQVPLDADEARQFCHEFAA